MAISGKSFPDDPHKFGRLVLKPYGYPTPYAPPQDASKSEFEVKASKAWLQLYDQCAEAEGDATQFCDYLAKFVSRDLSRLLIDKKPSMFNSADQVMQAAGLRPSLAKGLPKLIDEFYGCFTLSGAEREKALRHLFIGRWN
jgi:hypothetical protein